MSENETTAYVAKKHKYTFKMEPDESLRFYCNNCRTRTFHKTLVCISTSETDPEVELSFDLEYRISECSGCHGVSFIDSSICTDSDEYWNNNRDSVFSCRIYPIPEEGALKESRLHELALVLPVRVWEIYQETLSAIKNKLFIIAGIGLRAILDTVCRDKQIGKGRDSLSKRLKIMLDEKHLITPDENAILKAVKDFGNKSAHEGKTLTSYEVESALIVVEHILDKLYRIPMIKREFENDKQNISFIDEVFGTETEEK